MKPYLLQNEELKELVAKIPGWEIFSNHIEREFNFATYYYKYFNFFHQ